jgi:predicted transposase YbfD/YdcC
MANDQAGWLERWTHLRQVVVVKQTARHRDGKEKVELRYFVTNATTGMLTPRQLLRLVRLHWGIENDCNWSFDLQFGEDDGRWCTQNKATLVLGVLRMIAYNLLQWLRKVHVQVQAVNGATAPRPWRGMILAREDLSRLGQPGVRHLWNQADGADAVDRADQAVDHAPATWTKPLAD